MKKVHETKIVLRCAYCGIEHRFDLEVYDEERDGQHHVTIKLDNPTCDLMEITPVDLVQ